MREILGTMVLQIFFFLSVERGVETVILLCTGFNHYKCFAIEKLLQYDFSAFY